MTSDDFTRKSVTELATEFVALVVEADDLFMMAPKRKRNRIIDRHRSICDEILSRGESGTDMMVKLMSHSEVAVRGEVAARCLLRNIERDHAINVLADICDLREGNVSMMAVHALMVAGAFDMKTGPIRRPT